MFAHLQGLWLAILAFCVLALCSPVSQEAAATTSPTVVLVPGAWHLPGAFSSFSAELTKLSIPNQVVGCVTVNNVTASVSDDAAAIIKNALSPLIETSGKDVILYLHSYAGFPGSVAISGLSKSARTAKGLKGGVVGLIYQSAFVPLAGQTLVDAVGGMSPMWLVTGKTGLIDAEEPAAHFYNNETAAVGAAAVKNWVRGQSAKSVSVASDTPHYGDAAYDGKRFYIHTKYDNAVPLVSQQQFVANSGVKWTEHTLNWDHSPWLGEPATLAALVNTYKNTIVA